MAYRDVRSRDRALSVPGLTCCPGCRWTKLKQTRPAPGTQDVLFGNCLIYSYGRLACQTSPWLAINRHHLWVGENERRLMLATTARPSGNETKQIAQGPLLAPESSSSSAGRSLVRIRDVTRAHLSPPYMVKWNQMESNEQTSPDKRAPKSSWSAAQSEKRSALMRPRCVHANH